MPPKRASRKSAPSTQHTRSFSAMDNENDWDDEDTGDGGDAAGHDVATVELREMEESLKRSMAGDIGLRKEQKQLRLEREFEKHVSELAGRFNQKVLGCREEVIRIQDAHVTKLLTLTQRKSEVEAQIIEQTQELADAYFAIRGEFGAVLKGRSEDVDEAIEVLKKLDQGVTRGQA
ncbi:hypothetical protein LTR69_008183 [Exophiala sideris]|uniref:Uncharacterized protein n=1 Tax=Exophiala sideris TaxID=1016849 RepID=A0ABR0J4N2_9EURO|nr:hypothetical protein LTR69_008183 [Exophiala sideris]